jgi:hypothetical protein
VGSYDRIYNGKRELRGEGEQMPEETLGWSDLRVMLVPFVQFLNEVRMLHCVFRKHASGASPHATQCQNVFPHIKII